MHIDMMYVCRYGNVLASVYTCAEAEMSAKTLQCNSCSTVPLVHLYWSAPSEAMSSSDGFFIPPTVTMLLQFVM